ncbi:MAG: hypothetical protein ACRDXB_15745 [Actinomycetes bacterium]
MATSLGTPEKTALIALMLVGGEVSTPELKKRHGVDLRKDARVKLNNAKLITSRTDSSPHLHEITEVGLTRCEDLLADMERPPRTPAMLGVIFELLGPVMGYFRAHNIRLVDVLQSPTVEPDGDDLTTLIHRAYDELKKKPQDWVRLARLRPKLDGAERSEVDATLLAMTRTGLVHLAPDSDRKALTADDHEAAIRIGKEDKHLVAIEES